MSVRHVRPVVALAVASLLVGASVITAFAASPAHRTPNRVIKIVKGVDAGHWSPKTTRITPGGTIHWTAMSNSHTVTAYGGNWHFNHSLPFGATVSHRFTATGTFLFRCRIHSSLVNGHCEGMCGKIEVET